ncbi:MAG TPA: glycine cleavage system protein GcvH [Alphaproteobacteria bacterium]|nr:glycine cleavage system protein GcvH [Alphaproteobacteria bacterium]
MLKFTQDHEWIRLEADGSATVGITQYAQEQLGDVVFVELPALGKEVAKGGDAAVVESVKAASEVYAPASGKVVAVNDKLTSEPALVNSSPMAEGWFFKLDLKDKGELASLMDEAAYGKFCEGLH